MTTAACISDWRNRSIPVPATSGRSRNISRLRAMGGDPTCVPPDFNDAMLAIWEDLWHSMPQSGKVSASVHELLRLYKQKCSRELNRPGTSSEIPPPLLPVSFAQAKDWLLRKQKSLSATLESGAVNESAREVVADLDQSLAEQPLTTAILLEQPAPSAAPFIQPPVMSLGPEPVTAQMRAEERLQLKRAAPSKPRKKAMPKKKPITPEITQRHQRALIRMEELGVQPLKVF